MKREDCHTKNEGILELEKTIRTEVGNRNPFKVPDGYFEDFSKSFMENIPAEPERNTFAKIWRPMAYAACTISVILTFAVYFGNKNSDNMQQDDATSQYNAETTISHDTYIDVVADYAMMDNADIYACLSEE